MKAFFGCFFGCLVALTFVNVWYPWRTATVPDRSLMSLKVPDTYEPCRDAPDIIRRMAFSLDTEPTAWTSDAYHAERTGGGAMWVGNQAYGIEIGPERNKLRRVEDKAAKECLYAAYSRWVLNPVNFH